MRYALCVLLSNTMHFNLYLAPVTLCTSACAPLSLATLPATHYTIQILCSEDPSATRDEFLYACTLTPVAVYLSKFEGWNLGITNREAHFPAAGALAKPRWLLKSYVLAHLLQCHRVSSLHSILWPSVTLQGSVSPLWPISPPDPCFCYLILVNQSAPNGNRWEPICDRLKLTPV